MSHQLLIEVNGKSWVVPQLMVKEVEGREFVKLQPSRNSSLCRLLGYKPAKNASFANTQGYKDLVCLRNDVQTSMDEGDGGAAAELFDEPKVAKKRKKTSKVEASINRDQPSIIQIVIDGAGIDVLTGSHPQDTLWVEAKPEALQPVFEKIQSDGAGEKRPYKTVSGYMKNGKGRVVKKLPGGKLQLSKGEEL